MPRWISLGTCCAVLLACVLCVTWQRPTSALTLTESGEMKWRRGNMHTHSHWSDGDDYLEMIGEWYRDHGYQFLIFTDHNVLANTERWVNVEQSKGGREAFNKLIARFPESTQHRGAGDTQEVRLKKFDEVDRDLTVPGEFLLIQGEEISDKFARYPIHLNVSNVQELLIPRGGNSVYEVIQNNVDAALAQRERTRQPMIVHLNHPNFGLAVTAEDLMRVQGERFFEVYNGHPTVYNSGKDVHVSTDRIWDIVLSQRLGQLDLPLMYGLAVDDGHSYHDVPSRKSNPGRGWVMVLTSELSVAALVEALEAGRFYATSGVTLTRVDASETGLKVEIDPVPGDTYRIDFIGTRRGADLRGEPVLDDQDQPIRTTHRYSDQIGEVFHSVEGVSGEYRFTGDELYVRAEGTSAADHPNPSEPGDKQQAWVQPIEGPGKR